MTQQQLLQQARDVMVCGADAHRNSLKTAAIAQGRTAQQVSKAGTMRLALWVSKGTSAI
jgi:methionyl-tRNA synthetase